MSQRKKGLLLFLTAAVTFIALPGVVLFDADYQTGTFRLLIIINFLCTWAFFLTSSMLLDRFRRTPKWQKRLLAGVGAFYFLFVTFEVFYKVYTGMHFDLFYLIDSLEEVVQVIINVFGVWKFFGFVGLFMVLGVLYYLLFQGKFRILAEQERLELSAKVGIPIMMLCLVGVIYIPSVHGQLTPAYLSEMASARKSIEILTEDVRKYPQQLNGENLFILQLESGNGLALAGDAVVAEKAYEGVFYPHIRKVFEKGVFFPYFYAQSPMTNRAQVNILCALTNNIGTAFGYRPEELPTVCLPQLLQDRGYRTIAFRSDDLEFSNMGKFLEGVGFQEVHQRDIMKPEDKENQWGFDDCQFYHRAFDYLKREYPDPEQLFVFFEVSSHHYPFELKEEYAHLAFFEHLEPFAALARGKLPRSMPFIEHYLNSFAAQDYCVGDFYRRYRDYAEDTSHLFVLPDHSWPVGIHGNVQSGKGIFLDNTMIFLGYLAPVTKRVSTLDATSRFAQTDLVPTVMDLLSGTYQQNSIASVLEGGDIPSAHEQCYIQAQPYSGGELAIVRGPEKIVYSIAHQTVLHYDLDKDPREQNPTALGEGISYEEFRDQWYCSRYQHQFR